MVGVWFRGWKLVMISARPQSDPAKVTKTALVHQELVSRVVYCASVAARYT